MRRLALLVLVAAGLARADPPPPEPAPASILRGRVFELGSITPLPDAEITAAGDRVAITDAKGRFELALPAGPNDLVVKARDHAPLRLRETLLEGQGLTVEYRLALQPDFKRRYETTVHGEFRHEGDHFSLRGAELTETAGTLGDPLHAIGLLPGVAQPVPLLPIYVVRGDSPGANGLFLDGMRVPQLYHALAGGAFVHPRLIDRIDFYPGAYDATFGRYSGGVIDAETRPARADAPHGEIEVRPLDVSALVEVPLPKDVRIAAAGHYGDTGPIIRLFYPDFAQQYWDYQLRFDWKGLTVEALGSSDAIHIGYSVAGSNTPQEQDLKVTFHRVQIRERHRAGGLDVEAAVVGGIDQIFLLSGQGAEKLGLSARLNARYRKGWFTLAAGLDGELSRFQGTGSFTDSGTSTKNSPDELGDLTTPRSGIVGSAYLQATGEGLGRRLALTIGARADTYHTFPRPDGSGNVTLVGVDPRASARARLTDWLTVSAAGGLYQQPPSFPVALPGIDTYALQLGLQRAIHGSVSIEVNLPGRYGAMKEPLATSVRLTGFYQKFYNTNDVALDFTPQLCSSSPPESLSGVPAQITRQVNGQSFGLEVLARRSAGRVTGWIAYTLSRSERIYSCGLRLADFDQTHLLNLVLQARLPWNLLVSGRLGYSTGHPYTHLSLSSDPNYLPLRNNDRLPDNFELDLRIDREWVMKRFAISVFIEVLNVTYSPTILSIDYPTVDGHKRYDMPHFDGLSWILPWPGIRGRF